MARLHPGLVAALYWGPKRMSFRQIGEDIGCAPQTVWKCAVKYGIPRRPRNGRLIEAETEAVELYQQGLTREEIAARLNCTAAGVYGALIRAGAEIRSPGSGRQPRKRLPDPEIVRAAYWDEGLIQSEIAERYGVTPNAVTEYMRRHGIPRRPGGWRGHHLRKAA